MQTEQDILRLCEYAVKVATEGGATSSEARAQATSELETDIELAQIASVNQSIDTGIAVRVYVGTKMGSAFTNIPTEESVRDIVQLALRSAESTTEDPDFVSLPEPQKYAAPEGLWSEDVANRDPGSIVESTGNLISKASEAEQGLILMGGGTGVVSMKAAYANSNGVSIAEKGTISYVVAVAVAQTETGMTPMTFSFDISRDLNTDMDGTVEDVASTIRLCKKTAHGKSGKHTVVFHPHAYSQIMTYTLVASLRGDNVARGKSKIADKIGDKIASDIFSLVDDGLYPQGAATSIADDEGVPRQRTPLIESGVLRSFLWDTYWANKMGVKSTGNANRNMRSGLVEIHHSNLVVEPGKRDVESIIAGIDHGYFIQGVQGAHSSNPESGDFSVVGNPAFLIEKGKLVGSVSGLMVSGNIYELLQNVTETAAAPHKLQDWIAPEIVAENVDVIVRE
ncbi:MAG: TldD/PmbA family protein [Candidatus Thorarchaeota archaeon]